MHEISWVVVLLYSIPECFLVTWLGLQLVNVQPSLNRILALSIVYGPMVYIIRRLPLYYGIHTLLLTIIIIGLAVIFLRISVFKCTIGIVFGVIISLSLETMNIPLFTYFSNSTFGDVISSPKLSILLSLPKLLVMVGIGIWIKKKKIYLFKLGSA